LSEDVGFDGLFSPVALGPLTLANRIVVSPMTRVSAMENGEATPQMQRYYEQLARGGWGLIETEATYIDEEHSQCRVRQPGLATTRHRDAWRLVVNAVHAHGAAIFVQLQHAGALAEARRYCADTLAPSAIEPRSRHPLPIPRELTSSGIARIHEHFAQAAGLAIEAGFDGVELHGANGYLVDQFLTDYTNHRTDEYGGPIANRIRFAVEAVRAVRRVVPASFPVGLRLSQHKTADPEYTWPDGESDAETIFRSLVEAGASFLHVGGRNAPSCTRGGCLLSELARRVTGVVVMANGGLEEPARARALVASGGADLVSLARGALANPDWPRRVQSGLPLKPFDPAMIRPVATLDNAEAWQRRQRDSTRSGATVRRALLRRPETSDDLRERDEGDV
jgi:2,4-dienoyl-CoA reductase-like NADH-dependent reductase (Old Yellow Enzyme family)